jgi:hypothetical protein
MHPHIFLTLSSILFMSTISANAMAEKHPYLQIIAFDSYGLTLELTAPPFEIDTVQTPDLNCHQISKPPRWGKTLEPGSPELPVKSMLLQVPQHGDITTQVIEIQKKIFKNIDLCPVPSSRISADGEVTFHLVKNEAAYQTISTDTLLEMGAREILRGVPVSRLRIFPFDWHPDTQELHYAEKIRLSVLFENPLPMERTRAKKGRDDVYDALLEKVILNYQGQYQSTSPIEPPRRANAGNIRLRDLGDVRNVRQVDSAPLDEAPTRHVKQSDALKIEITEAGIYRIFYKDLADAGLRTQYINPERLRLFNQGKEVAIRVVSETQSQFKPDDFIEFYATDIDNTFTGTNVYWLYWRKKGFGKRMAQINGFVTGGGEKMEAFYEHLHIEGNGKFWLETPDAPVQDYWFWQRLNGSDVKELSLNIPSPMAVPSREAIVRLAFQGRSTAPPHPNHHTLIKLNGTVIGDEFWDGDSTYIQEMTISSEILVAGDNTLTVEMPGDTGAIVDVIYLNWVEIDYWRHFEAVENDSLGLTVNGNGNLHITVEKLSKQKIVIYDVTNLDEVAEVVNFSVEGEKRNYQATFETQVTGEKTYYVSTTQQIKSPIRIALMAPAKLKAPKNGADYILITDKEFLQAVQPLGEFRRRQGLRVKMISVQDIYNEFNDGLSDPTAIKDFLRYAYENWNRPAPTYVFFVGDASLNYRNTKKNKVPAHLSASWEGLTPDDNWYVSVDGNDILPDMFIGRIPSGDNPETVAALIDKIIRFEESTRENPRKILLVADSSSEFEDLNELLFGFLPAHLSADKIYLREYLAGVDKDKTEQRIAKATRDISASFNDGVMISNYIGHGVTDRWSKSKGLYNPDHVHKLKNEEQLAFTLMLTCINGYFIDPNKYSFAEEFLLARGGAIAAFAPSNVSYTWEDMILGKEIFSSIFEQGNKIMGTITTQGKIAAYEQGTSQSVLQMFTLFGDPALSLKEWE